MKIDKAIELLNTAKEGFPVGIPSATEKYYKAIELGIEALSLIKYMRLTYPNPELLSLPGETKD